MRFLLLSLLLTYMASASMDIYPKKECELFNNLKHTKNRGHEVLKMDRAYEMLKHHKEQYLVKVEGATPPQRWINDDCLSLRPLRGTPIYNAMHSTATKPTVKKTVSIEDELSKADTNMAKKTPKKFKKSTPSSKQNLLALSWHNAFCETHRYKKECKRGLSNLLKRKASDTHFVLHGLWPQPRNNVYCHLAKSVIEKDKAKRWRQLPSVELDTQTSTALAQVMPGFKSQLHKHEWIKHGTCYGKDANGYFTDAVSLVKQVNNSALGMFFTQNIGQRVSLKQIQLLADKAFGRGAGKRVALQCKRGMITELWFNLGGSSSDLSQLLQSGKPAYSRCKGGRIDKAGYGR